METYMEHIELLKEWNEETSFYATSTAVLMTELGVQVVQDVDVRTIIRTHPEGTKELSDEVMKVQVWAIYGDEDILMRLIVCPNVKDPEVLVKGTAIRG